jgi:aminopeptidase N
MIGDTALQHALATYRPDRDNDPSYFQKLLQANSKRDLEWFFDDWVYRDRGLPELHVETAYSRPLLSDKLTSFMVTVTIENRGRAGAEVPVLVETPSGDKVVRVIVKAKDKGVGRIELPVAPKHIKVNDGSVPEVNMDNNVYDMPDPQKS